ncbi:adenine nucleotide alpha hydrolases-like protein [Xylaria nigripes]|nr:adenine nucleotide alpha hydrolases-like protein [Xylaria nigripes]
MASTGAGESLSVVALISGGKDSFFSILHCQANGHRVVALANLYPSGETPPQQARHNELPGPCQYHPSSPTGSGDIQPNHTSETDLNSFMYQTVGHQIIPLYAQATGLPLHRHPIVGTAVQQGLSYAIPHKDHQDSDVASGGSAAKASGVHEQELEDETESLVPLLRAVLTAHPEANALCTGAILSTYQRTRVESVALRLGLVPLSYLWQFTELPASISNGYHNQITNLASKVARTSSDVVRRSSKRSQGPARDDARLLRDMAAVGLEARIVKVASAGLDEDFLWENVASSAGVQRVERAMRRYGAAGGRGSVLGEGGEFETLVIDGPSSLFKGRIVISAEDRRVIREGGGCAWLRFPRADVVQKKDERGQTGAVLAQALDVSAPELLDPRFEETMQCLFILGIEDIYKQMRLSGSVSSSLRDAALRRTVSLDLASEPTSLTLAGFYKCQPPLSPESIPVREWCYFGGDGARSSSAVDQIGSIVDQIRRQLDKHALPATAITNSVIVLRRMSDFPLVNERYGSLFNEPNPPSRVTISCGDKLLPKDAMIAVYLTVQLRLKPHERRGLHVQSRSYWAPANIGPYSQAIAFPLLPLSNTEHTIGADTEDGPTNNSHTLNSPFAVSVAGQIPLVPASMTLPPPSTIDPIKLEITLALQHLWRVGTEMHVRWWTSAVAYFPAAPSDEIMQQHALVAATAWKSAHLWPDVVTADEDSKGNDELETSDDDDSGPDLWDRRYNSQFMTYGDEEESFPLSLPNWRVLRGFDEDVASLVENKAAHIPFFFAAEVDELPRGAGVEWHAHLGLAELQSGSVALLPVLQGKSSAPDTRTLDLEIRHVAVESEGAVFVQTIAVVPSSSETRVSVALLRGVFDAVTESIGNLLGVSPSLGARPKITYAEALCLDAEGDIEGVGAVVPCRSLWDSEGRRLGVVCVFESRVLKGW